MRAPGRSSTPLPAGEFRAGPCEAYRHERPVRERWTHAEFFAWAETQDSGCEFDGFQPVAMTGGNASHSASAATVLTALRSRRRGSGCYRLGPDAGVETADNAVRSPDALVTCSKCGLADQIIPVIDVESLRESSGAIGEVRELFGAWSVSSLRRCCAGSRGVYDKVNHVIEKVHVCVCPGSSSIIQRIRGNGASVPCVGKPPHSRHAARPRLAGIAGGA
jgi:hypothetical protein